MQVIFNADDFGRAASVNAAVEQAHRAGVLTSTSLMVGGEACTEAVRLAKAMPHLAVGLHVVVAGAKPVLPPDRIPHLVDDRGFLIDEPARIGLRYFTSPVAQAELRSELEAQFDRFAATGLPLSHVDGHLHMHVHPTVMGVLIPLAESYGARGFRLPRDDLRLALCHSRKHVVLKMAWAVVYAALCYRLSDKLWECGLSHTDRVYGLMQTGAMTEAYVTKVLRESRATTAELYFHPATEPSGEPMGPNPGDLATLLSAPVQEAVKRRGLEPATYSTLRRRAV